LPLLRPQAGVRIVLSLATNGLPGFPATATFGFSANGIRASEFGPGSLTAFGATISFTGVNGPPAYDAALRALLSGSAAIDSLAWAIPLTETPFTTLAEAE